MRVGRLRPQTLQGILLTTFPASPQPPKSATTTPPTPPSGFRLSSIQSDLGNSFDPTICPLPDDIFIPRITKQYIPTRADNPLYFSSAEGLGDWLSGTDTEEGYEDDEAGISESGSHNSDSNPASTRASTATNTNVSTTTTNISVTTTGSVSTATIINPTNSLQISRQSSFQNFANATAQVHSNPQAQLNRTPSISKGLEIEEVPRILRTESSLRLGRGESGCAAGLKKNESTVDVSASTREKLESEDAKAPELEKDWESEYMHIDADWSMRTMDKLFNASFYEYVRDERNCECTAQHLIPIVKDYKLRQVAHALRWLVQGWRIETVAKLLRMIFSDWLPDLAGYVFSQMTKGWPLRPQITLCTALILVNEKANVTAVFIRGLSIRWSFASTCSIIQYLIGVLEWNSEYFSEFQRTFLECMREDAKSNIESEYSAETMQRAVFTPFSNK
ncbi:hypothetical protein HK098_002013 [Nowakowskiella sp. JEL0407]|nr:hypothetical protein HK098_002013 [Nowakowskiella sp. JEL0407]